MLIKRHRRATTQPTKDSKRTAKRHRGGRKKQVRSPFENLENRTMLTWAWMGELPDNTLLTDMAIPATHDTMSDCAKSDCPVGPTLAARFEVLEPLSSALDSILGSGGANVYYTQTQVLPLRQQLEMGIRGLDIRVKNEGTVFSIVHDKVPLGYEFEKDVLKVVADFLYENPSETIVMHLYRQDSERTGSRDLLNNYLDRTHQRSGKRYRDFYENVHKFGGGARDVTLEQVRGKFAIWGRDEFGSHGFKFRSKETHGEYQQTDIDTKFSQVRQHFRKTDQEIGDSKEKIWSTWLNVSDPDPRDPGHDAPIEMANGSGFWVEFPALFPVVKRHEGVKGLNERVLDFLRENPHINPGLVMIDFPGEALVQQIVLQNEFFPMQEEFFVNAGGPLIDGVSHGDQVPSPYLNPIDSKVALTPEAIDMNHPSVEDASMELYQSERYGEMSWDIPTKPGNYEVSLHFAEITYNNPGSRIFDVWIENELVLDDYDIVADVGPKTAVVKKFVVSSNELLEIVFLKNKELPKISGIYVTPVAASIRASKDTYEIGEEITFEYVTPGQLADQKKPDWIGIHQTGPYNVQRWQYTTGASGSMTFDFAIKPGHYTASLYCCDDSRVVYDSVEFEVGPAPAESAPLEWNMDEGAGTVITNGVMRENPASFSFEETWVDGPYFGSKGTHFADVTGDGRADAIVVNNEKITVRRSTGTGFSGNESWTDGPYFGSKGTHFADVTGDGRADAIVVNNEKITVRRSTGTGFSGNESWTDGPYFGSKGTHFADVTGDGMADAIVINDEKITVRRSTGTGFSSNESWADGFFGDNRNFFADVTGDGKADYVYAGTLGIFVEPSTGSAFGSVEGWADGAFSQNRGTHFADVTGDGKADAIIATAENLSVRPSTGTAFGNSQSWTDVGFLGERQTSFADVTGNSRMDAITVNDDGVVIRPSTGTEVRVGRGNFVGDPQWVSGVVGTAVEFDGDGDGILVDNQASRFGRGDFTVATWVKTTESGSLIRQRSTDSALDGQFSFEIANDGHLRFWTYDEGKIAFDFRSNAPVNDGTWHHVAAQREGREGRIYIDGRLVGTTEGDVAFLDPQHQIAIGYDPRDNDRYLNGVLDEVRVYSSAALDVQAISQARKRAINVGGTAIPGASAWSADNIDFPSQLHNQVANVATSTDDFDLSHPSIPAGTPEELFMSERWDPAGGPEMEWDIPVAPGRYEVSLYFAELAFDNVGSRVFDVSIEGNKVLDGYDINADVGPKAGVVKTFVVTTDGNLDIDFGHEVENPKVAAISFKPAAESVCDGLAESLAKVNECASNIPERDAILAELNLLPADLNGDGEVGFPDFLILSQSFGRMDDVDYTDGDIDLDGEVGFTDFLALSSNFGKQIDG